MLVVVDVIVVDPDRVRIVAVDPADEVGAVVADAVVYVDASATPPIDLVMVDLHVLAGVHRNPVCIVLPHGRERIIALPTIEADPADAHVIAGKNAAVFSLDT